ncbi:AEC family transporter [Candidatus Aquicultor secundus]|uniref:AEC family transporter n=1 Tax=Candidatus Aquicultor secundus TaxID=1973895 RepID=UPI00257C1B64|nr:AEC family transporter [Candidatus Aquicultor secundus]
MLSILILISIGFISKRVGLLEKAHTLILNNIIIYLTMPALIFRAVFESRISLSLLKIPLVALAIAALSMGVAYIVGRFLHLKRPTFGAFLLVAAIGNTGYLGYPLTLQLFGIGNLVKAVFYDLSGTVVFTFTIGLLVAQRYGQGNGKVNIIKEVFTFPPLIGLLVALVVKGLGIGLPNFLTDTIGFLAGATIPLVMLTIGLSLELTEVRTYALAIAVVVLIKLVVAPIVAMLGGNILGMSGSDLGIMVLEASMPSFLLSLVVGLRYGLDTDFLPAAIVVTTMLSMITIPVWQYLLKAIS